MSSGEDEEKLRREFFEKLSVFNNQYDVALTRAPIMGGKNFTQNFPFAVIVLLTRWLTSENFCRPQAGFACTLLACHEI